MEPVVKLADLTDVPPWDWPHDAAQRILDALESASSSAVSDPDELLAAARLAGEYTVMSDEVAEALLAVIARDVPAEIRASCANSLGTALEDVDSLGLDGPDIVVSPLCFRRIQKALRGLYFDGDVPELVRRRVLEASARAPTEWHPNAVRAAAVSGDRGWHLTALFCMGYVSGFDKELVNALQSSDQDIVLEAAIAAGKQEVDPAWPYLVELVKPTEPRRALRLAAIDALSTIRPAASQSVLEELLDDSDEEIAEAASEAFGMAMVFAERVEDDLDDLDDL